tara:strand:+ start:13452 stop:13685 length:234 start_codon:yes stop_codon:yes gene_type:complete
MKQFEMTQEQLNKIISACQSPPLIMLQCGSVPSVQERANAAWKTLGDEMGFDHMTVRPADGGDPLFFEAMEKPDVTI